MSLRQLLSTLNYSCFFAFKKMNAAMGEKNVVPGNMFLSERFYQYVHLKEENAKDLTLIISLSGSITNQLILHSSLIKYIIKGQNSYAKGHLKEVQNASFTSLFGAILSSIFNIDE